MSHSKSDTELLHAGDRETNCEQIARERPENTGDKQAKTQTNGETIIEKDQRVGTFPMQKLIICQEKMKIYR